MKSLILFFYALSFSYLFAQMDSNTNQSMNGEKNINKCENIWDVFQNRRSIRKFKSDSIPHDDIIKIVKAASMAPTSGNQQPWKFLIVTDKNKINEMKEACIKESLEYIKKKGQEIDSTNKERITNVFNDYLSAPVYIIVLTDNNSIYSSYNHWDGPLAAGYLLLAARALGYGSVFITDAISENVTKQVLNIPDNFTRICITPIGIPVEWPKTPEKKQLEELIVNEKF
jgi:nitroreductase